LKLSKKDYSGDWIACMKRSMPFYLVSKRRNFFLQFLDELFHAASSKL